MKQWVSIDPSKNGSLTCSAETELKIKSRDLRRVNLASKVSGNWMHLALRIAPLACILYVLIRESPGVLKEPHRGKKTIGGLEGSLVYRSPMMYFYRHGPCLSAEYCNFEALSLFEQGSRLCSLYTVCAVLRSQVPDVQAHVVVVWYSGGRQNGCNCIYPVKTGQIAIVGLCNMFHGVMQSTNQKSPSTGLPEVNRYSRTCGRFVVPVDHPPISL